MTMKKTMAVCLALWIAAGMLAGCQPQEKPLTRTVMAMDTVMTLSLYDIRDEAVLDACTALIEKRESQWSRTPADSDIARANAADGQPTEVDASTVQLLESALAYTRLTDGAFDVTTAVLSDLWKQAQAADTLPETAQREEALAKTGADKVVLDNTTVTLTGGAQLDLGAIAKGQLADELSALLTRKGCHSALIDLGGNIYAHGTKTDGSPFTVGIAHPHKDNALAATVAVSDMAVVTSGSYERGYTVNGKRYSHILDPATGLPVENDLASVTILTASACTADVLSTACFVMGYDAARVFVDSTEGVEAVFVLTDGTVVMTDGVTVA